MVARGGRGSGRVNRHRTALHDYAKHIGRKLEHHPLTQKLKKCNSVDSITSVQNMQWCSENSEVTMTMEIS